MKSDTPSTLVLDLEGTLLTGGVTNVEPRPGLHRFLEGCKALFTDIVLYSFAEPESITTALNYLVDTESAPVWLTTIPVFTNEGELYKDLRRISKDLTRIVLVDDMQQCVHPDQYDLWVEIGEHSKDDSQMLMSVLHILKVRCVSWVEKG